MQLAVATSVNKCYDGYHTNDDHTVAASKVLTVVPRVAAIAAALRPHA